MSILNMRLFHGICLIIVYLTISASGYSVPEPKVELLSPKGFRISIPHYDKIVLVIYHVNINKPIALHQPGSFSADITQPTNGRWTYENTNAFIDPGDKVNYWLHVQYGNYAYRKSGSQEVTGEPVDINDPIQPDDTPKPNPTNPSGDCEKSITTVGRKPVCKGQLIFEDNFNNLNWTMWKREVRIPLGADDAEFVSFQSRPENSYVSEGQLHIVPNLLSELPGFNVPAIRNGNLNLGTECTGIIDIPEECTRCGQFSQILPPIVSARIRTKEFFSFRYGKVEVRAKLPKGDWLFPLILLEPLENYYGFTGYASGQMRVAFSRGNEFLEDKSGDDISGSRVYGGPVLTTGEELRDIYLKSSFRRSHLGNEFHTYALTWTDTDIVLEIDGNEYATIRGGFAKLHETHNLQHASLWDHGHIMAPFDREFFLTLGVSAGGHSDFPNGCLNGQARIKKVWRNGHPKAELRFWNDRENWLRTWSDDSVGLHVDYIRVYAL